MCGEECTQGPQTATYVAGVYGTTLSIFRALPVLIDSSGHLGTAFTLPHIPGPILPSPSWARYKRDIHDMGDTSGGLMKLRPVSFRYKQDPEGSDAELVENQIAEVGAEETIAGLLRVPGETRFKPPDRIAAPFGVR